MISGEYVKKMAELARIDLTSEEEKKLTQDLAGILGYIEKLKEANVSGVEMASHAFNFNDFRPDVPPEETHDPKPLIEAVPETETGFVKVKKIFNPVRKTDDDTLETDNLGFGRTKGFSNGVEKQ